MLKAKVIFITSLKASVTVFLSVSLSVCHRYLQMTNPDKVFGKLWLLCIIDYNWNKNYSEATVRNDMGLSINSFSFRSVLDRKFVKIVSIWYSIEGPNSLLVNLQCWYDFLCNLIHFTQGIANVSSVYLQLKFMTEKSVQTFGRKVIFIDILLM